MFLFCIITGTTIYFLQFFSISLPPSINNYLNDFLIVPIVLYISLYILKRTRNDSSFFLKIPIVLYVCFLYSIIFEYFLPKYVPRYTKDLIDVMLYFASGAVFYFLQKRK
jgi:hypothetical protein